MVGPRFRKELHELRDDVEVKVTVPAVSRAVAPRSAHPVMPAVRGGSTVWQLVPNSSAPPTVTVCDKLQSLNGWASYPPTPMKVGPSPATVLTLSAQRAEENLWRHLGVVGSGQAGDQA